jgi:CheY-like chemotaxis protein/anti-sigma regulatory factor (Ser/Thr protein kinase)
MTMKRVLIVDDSDVDRMFAGKTLEKEKELELEFCRGAREALEVIAGKTPDLVITDLMMPGMTGLELVDSVRANHPLLPVILLTSRGNEEIAVEALQRGAASYVPKRMLVTNLLETVQKVLALSGEHRGQARLMTCFREVHQSFVLENDSGLIPALVIHAENTAGELGLSDESGWLQVGIALEEMLLNALYHGNLEISSKTREKDFRMYGALIKERMKMEPYRDRKIHVDLQFLPDQARFVVRDEGPGFDLGILPVENELPDVGKVSGRGIFLARTFMDELVFNQAGNEVTIVKRKAAN